ncbi:MAG TPA: extracellular solute-binding protein [Alcaligenes sp.]|nr:extracellular solute-binding protein [Alcaligenes sp.]HRL27315.1 extracellular solute-binding protein [Alcaligenes sp.]
MKNLRGLTLKQCVLALATAVGGSAALLYGSAALAAVDIQVWTALNPHNQAEFEKLVKDFNRSQKDVKVEVKAHDSDTSLDQALRAVSGAQLPNLVQLGEMSGLDEVADRPYILPMHTLLAKENLSNVSWFLASNSFVRNGRGQLQGFPYMAEIPVMYYNTESFNKAKLEPAAPSRVWLDLQGQLVQLANNGSRRCPLTSDQSVSINLENLAAVNNQIYGLAPGPKVKGKVGFDFDLMYIRHLSMMVSWVKSELMVKPEMLPQSPQRFAKGECAVMFSNSGHIGEYNATRGLKFAVTGLPYYPEVTQTPGKPFVTGGALWATKGHAADQNRATARFVSWLAQPENATRWYQQTGFLPLSREAFNATGSDYYSDKGDWQHLVGAYGSGASGTAKGNFRNYRQIRAVFNQSLESALDGKQPATTALRTAAAEANRLVAQRGR